jgi:DnaJ homolog subfamily A member 5
MQCHYHILQVDKHATAADILKAYRKQALLHHPDKNRDRIEEATEYFTLIQEAYQILSDEHERKWYDMHRDEILRGPLDLSNRGVSQFMSKDQITLFHTRTAFSDYDDLETGFYSVYRNLFIKIDLEEQQANQIDPYALAIGEIDYCPFGDSNTTGESLIRFYNRFLFFSSIKSFSWFDLYRPLDYPDRYQRRIAEKKNKKARDDARKEFNESVCELALWLRKRDPRIQKQIQQQEELQKLQKERFKEMQKQERSKRIQEALDYVEPEWATMDDVEYEQEIYECVVCNLEFKSEKQMKRHESSQYHLEQVELLRAEMEGDDAFINDDYLCKIIENTGISERFECKVCDKQFQSLVQLEQHLSSKKHRQQVKNDSKQKSNIPKTNSDPTLEQSGPAPKEILKKTRKKPAGIFCNSCKQVFSSRTKLFEHIRESGHASAK